MRPETTGVGAAARRGLQLALVTAPAAVFAIHVSGCSLVGLGGGAVIDIMRKERTPRSIVKIQQGSSLTLLLRDGRTLHGRFEGRRDMDPEDYARVWAKWAAWRGTAAGAQWLPSPGDTVLLTGRGGSSCFGRLVAFQIDAVEVAAGNETCLVRMESVESVADLGGRSVDGELLRAMVREASIPLSTLVSVKTRTTTVEIPLHEVRLVEGPAPRGGKIVGFVVGLGIDALFVSWMASSSTGCGQDTYSWY